MSERQVNEAPIIDSQGELTDPADDTVVADTGQITSPGLYDILVLAVASASAQVKLQHRNAANTANVDDESGIYVPANQSVVVPWRFAINNKNERIRVIMDDALTGTMWCSINAQRVA